MRSCHSRIGRNDSRKTENYNFLLLYSGAVGGRRSECVDGNATNRHPGIAFGRTRHPSFFFQIFYAREFVHSNEFEWDRSHCQLHKNRRLSVRISFNIFSLLIFAFDVFGCARPCNLLVMLMNANNAKMRTHSREIIVRWGVRVFAFDKATDRQSVRSAQPTFAHHNTRKMCCT